MEVEDQSVGNWNWERSLLPQGNDRRMREFGFYLPISRRRVKLKTLRETIPAHNPDDKT